MQLGDLNAGQQTLAGADGVVQEADPPAQSEYAILAPTDKEAITIARDRKTRRMIQFLQAKITGKEQHNQRPTKVNIPQQNDYLSTLLFLMEAALMEAALMEAALMEAALMEAALMIASFFSVSRIFSKYFSKQYDKIGRLTHESIFADSLRSVICGGSLAFCSLSLRLSS